MKKWLDGLGEIKKVASDGYSEDLSAFEMGVNGGNYYTILEV